jgi:hypothetical protein
VERSITMLHDDRLREARGDRSDCLEKSSKWLLGIPNQYQSCHSNGPPYRAFGKYSCSERH